jgi:hypothetical protein
MSLVEPRGSRPPDLLNVIQPVTANQDGFFALDYGEPNWARVVTRKPQMPSEQPTIRPESEFDISGCVPTICTCDRQRRVPSWLLCAARPPGPLGFRCSVPRDGWRERDWKTSALKARRPFAARYLWWRKRQNRFKGSISACGVARRRNDGVVSDGIVSSPITLDRLIVPALG